MFLSRLHHGINLFYYYIKIIDQIALCNKQHVFPMCVYIYKIIYKNFLIY